MAKENFGTLLLLFQIILIILFIVFFDGAENFTSERETARTERRLFVSVHVYTFLGFGLIVTFLKRYCRGMLVHTLLIGAVVIQWATLLQGLFTLKSMTLHLNLMRIVNADFAVIAVLVTMGAIIGKCNSLQLLVCAAMETIFFAGNEAVCLHFFKMADFGRSVIVHVFGAFFGLGVSRMIYSKTVCTSRAISMSRKSEIYSLIGTIFLWTYWPSVNGAYVDVSLQNQAMANTVYALISSSVTSAALSIMYSKEWKFNILHLQNATLVGGIAIGSIAALTIPPWSAVFIGISGSIGSILTYVHVLPRLSHYMCVHDMRGVIATHGVPGILSGITSVITSYLANEARHGSNLYKLYPALAPPRNTTKYNELNKISSIPAGSDRSAVMQSYIQLATLVITLFVATIGGHITGYIIGKDYFEPVRVHHAFDDHDDFEEANCIDMTSLKDDGIEVMHAADMMRNKERGSSFLPFQNRPYSMHSTRHDLSLPSVKGHALTNGFSLPNVKGHIPLEDLRHDKKRSSTFLSVKSYHGAPLHSNKQNSYINALSQPSMASCGKRQNSQCMAIPQIVITDVDGIEM